jgi:acetoin utilization deacetylase AcuC-like enzyme
LKWFFTEAHRLHDPEIEVWAGVPGPSTEVASRAEAIAAALAQDSVFDRGGVNEHGREPIERVHDPALVRWLEDAWQECRPYSERREIIPDTVCHAGMVEGLEAHGEPFGSPLGRLGFWCFDTMTPLVEGTYQAARGAVDVALSALDAVVGGERWSYALCRPPGHHAGRSMIGGFCFFNNAAIVAEEMVKRAGAPVAILDVDFHHGNGTQQIFFARGDVVYVSLHADPDRAFPYFTGRVGELGQGDGAGANRNYVLGEGCDDADYLETLERALSFIAERSTGGLVVSLGVDTYLGDPLGDLKVTKDAYWPMGHMVDTLGLPTVVVQEGGYGVPSLGPNVRSWLRGLIGVDPIAAEMPRESESGGGVPARHV